MRFSVLFALCTSLLAQSPYGNITGRVVDSADAVVPDVSIQVINTGTGVVVPTVSDSQGNYQARNLIPGTYRLIVEKPGFRRYQREPIEVRVGDVLTVDIALQLGVVSDSITVTAEAPLLQSAESNLGMLIDQRRLLDLPLPGSSPMYLPQLTPGIISATAPTSSWLPQVRFAISNFATDGAGSLTSEITLDGMPNMMRDRINRVPAPEMLQEVRVQTAVFDASVGHFTGAQVNMVTKSGTNTLHGNLTYSYYSRPLMTRPFFVNRFLYDTSSGPLTQQKIDSVFPPTRFNRYRASAGGPVVIPRLYNGRNRTFWTYGYERLLKFDTSVNSITVPTAAERGGDFSALLNLGPQYQIYDPATIAPAPAGRYSRQPVAGNIIPPSRIDPIAKRLLGYYPLPNVAGTAEGLNNFTASPATNIHFQTHTARIDHVINDNHRLFGSFTQSRERTPQQVAIADDFFGDAWLETDSNFALDDVIAWRPTLVLELRYGLTRGVQTTRPGSLGFDLLSLGLPASFVDQLDRSFTTLPTIAAEGYVTIPPTNGGQTLVTNYHYFAGSLAQTRGNHGLRYGGEYRVLQENLNPYANIYPTLNFSSNWTRGPLDSSAAAPVGQGLASFLLGLPTGGSISRNASYAQQSGYLGLFFQDDWKITRKLTLNLGLRYELDVPTTERFNRTVRGFDLSSPNPIQDVARAQYALSPIAEVPVDSFRTTGGLLFANVNGVPRGLWDTDRNNFAPRLGLAYLLRPRTVLRAGYGIYYESLGADRNFVIQQGFSRTTSLTPSLDNGLSFHARLANLFPDGIQQPLGAAGALKTFLGLSPSFFTPGRRNGYMQRWSFNVQQELRSRTLVEIGYVGNRGADLGVGKQLDATPARYLSTSLVRDQATIDFLSQAVPNPFYGLPEFVGSNLQGRTVTRSQLLLPYPQFSGVSTTLNPGFSWYHSLQVRAEKRFSQGYTLQASYTWSKLLQAISRLNASDADPEYVISTVDRPHRIVISGIYELPVGRGKHWLSGARGWRNHLVGGWTLQGIYQGQSGPPIGFGNIVFTGDLHDLVLPRSERKVERWFNTAAGFERDARKQLTSNLRSFPSRLTGLRADGYNDCDLSLFKHFQLAESVTFQLRAEAVDAFNHAMFSAPNTSPTSSLFGQVTSGAAQRTIMVGGRLLW